jgi:predicted nucleic acid-binding protein
VQPATIAPTVLADPDDDHVLACALAAKAELIVSGDRHLLHLHEYQGIPILNTADALKRLEAKSTD